MKKIVIFAALFLLFAQVMNSQASKGQSTTLPAKGMVTMVDLGAKKCIPCKMMAPILVKLEKDYKGKAAIYSWTCGKIPHRQTLRHPRDPHTNIF